MNIIQSLGNRPGPTKHLVLHAISTLVGCQHQGSCARRNFQTTELESTMGLFVGEGKVFFNWKGHHFVRDILYPPYVSTILGSSMLNITQAGTGKQGRSVFPPTRHWFYTQCRSCSAVSCNTCQAAEGSVSPQPWSPPKRWSLS